MHENGASIYQHESSLKAHDAMGHQDIAKVLARIQQRHTWLGIRKSFGQYVGQYLTCQQVRNKPGEIRFHLKIFEEGLSMNWCNMIVQKVVPLTRETQAS